METAGLVGPSSTPRQRVCPGADSPGLLLAIWLAAGVSRSALIASIAKSRGGGARLAGGSRGAARSEFPAPEVGLQAPHMPLSHKDDSWPSPRFNTMIASIVDLPCPKTV
jgi:hypothetical protein